MKTDTTKKQIVISGALGGIGHATALKLAYDGHLIHALTHSSSEEKQDTFLKSLPGQGHTVILCDVTDEDGVKDTLRSLERIDVCIHAAVSPLVRKRISVIKPIDFVDQFQVSAFGALNLFQAVIPCMKKQGSGSLISITSSAIRSGSPATTMSGYVCAKFALYGILRECLLDLSVNNIRVNAVAPDFVVTPLHQDLPEPALAMLKKTGTTSPEDVALIIAKLCAEENSSVTGKTFYMDGSTSDIN